MKRITKIGSVGIAIVLAVPLFLALDWFQGAEAAEDAPLLYAQPGPRVIHAAHAEAPLPEGPQIYAYVTDPSDLTDPGAFIIRAREEAGARLFEARAPAGAPSWRFVDVQMSRDGADVLAARLDGTLHFVTSTTTLYDTHKTFDTESRITAIAIEPGGDFFAAVTYNGELFLFQRDAFLDAGRPIYYTSPYTESPVSKNVGDGLDAVVEYRNVVGPTVRDFTLRPYSHLTFAGSPRTPHDGKGLAVVAGTVYGELYAYDVDDLAATSDPAPYRPAVHHSGGGRCQTVSAGAESVELPCNSKASIRLIERIDGSSGGAADIVTQAVAKALAERLTLDHLVGLTLGAGENPLVALDASRGAGIAGRHVVASATASGIVDALSILPGSLTDEGWLDHLWSAQIRTGVGHAAVSYFHGSGADRRATLAVATADGWIHTYEVRPSDQEVPVAALRHDAFVGLDRDGIRHLGLSRGDGPLGEAAAGTYVAYVTESGRVALVDTRLRLDAETPTLAWEGPVPLGPVRAFDVTDGGSVLLGSDGLALYASMVTARIVAPDKAEKMVPFRAEAVVESPDSVVTGREWRVEAVDTKRAVDAVTYGAAALEHLFRVEGTYRILLTLSDDKGLTVRIPHAVTVGGANPIIVYTAPTNAAVGRPVTFDFSGSRDPDSAASGHHGLSKIEFHPYGDGRSTLVDLETMTVTWDYGNSAGVHSTTAVGSDMDGRKGHAQRLLRITGAGYGVSAEPAESGPLRLKGLAVARDTGHLAAFGGDHAQYGRIQLRGPETDLLYSLGSQQASSLASPVTAGVLTPDGSVLYAGKKDGSVVRMPVAAPTDRVALEVFDAPVVWLFAARDGKSVTAVTADGDVASLDPGLSSVVSRHELGVAPKDVAADEMLVHLVVWTDDGRLLVLDAEQPGYGVLDAHAAQDGVTALGMTPNLDPQGRAWVFLGRATGEVETIKLQGNRFYSQGNATYDPKLPIHDFSVGALDSKSDYRVSAVSRSTKLNCQAATTNPCGSVYYADTRGPRENGVPVPSRSYELAKRPIAVGMTDDGRQVLVIAGDTKHEGYRFDVMWRDGPLSTLTALPGKVLAFGMAQTGAGYLLTDTGQIAWAYAPARAAFQIGPHNETGAPVWGERVSAGTAVTFDSSPTVAGDGTVISWEWTIDDETYTTPEVETSFDEPGSHFVRLTVTTRVAHPVEALLVDRYEKSFAVWDPPPVASLVATPFDAAQGAVVITTGDNVRFDASGSYDPRGQRIATYRYVFGDGAETAGGSAVRNHVYPKAGVFWARVTAYDSDGFGGASERIKVLVENRAPSAAFRMEQPGRNETTGTVTLGVPVSFDGSLSSDPDGQVSAWEWVLSDGTTVATSRFHHTFTDLGPHTVQLRVRDNTGDWSTPLTGNVLVDDGIRLRHTQDPPSGSSVGPTQPVSVEGLVHTFRGFPAEGDAVSGAKVHIDVFFDGPLGSDPATTPYDSAIKTSDAVGIVFHTAPFNQAGIAYQPGRYRLEMTAVWTASANGDTEWSEKTVSTFIVHA